MFTLAITIFLFALAVAVLAYIRRKRQPAKETKTKDAEEFKRIPLTQGKFSLVDAEDFERVNQFKWCVRCAPKDGLLYATRSVRRPKGTTISMARFIMQTPKGMICDHINHDTLDNRKSNLRNVTLSQSQMNKKHTHSRIGLKNICLVKDVYRVRIKKNHQTVFEKEFQTLDEAITARDEALKKHHGEFACLE